VTVLGFDTATPSTAVALLEDGGALHEARDDVPIGGGRGHHAERVLELAAGLLAQAGLNWSEIDRVAVGLGPGGYTGLRIGIATARGLARAHGAELIGVGTLRALAQPVTGATALAVLDARRGELFVAAYADDAEVLAPRVIVLSELAELDLAQAPAPLLAVGDGALAQRALLDAAKIPVAPEQSVLHRVSGAAICRLAAAAVEGVPAPIAPIYLRLPDAELALRATTP
jgi:tRNA threonylcarbamoyladenosine biosynthesis protein TsaB